MQRAQAGRALEGASELRMAANSARKSSRPNRSTSTAVLQRTVAVARASRQQRRFAERVAWAQRRQRDFAPTLGLLDQPDAAQRQQVEGLDLVALLDDHIAELVALLAGERAHLVEMLRGHETEERPAPQRLVDRFAHDVPLGAISHRTLEAASSEKWRSSSRRSTRVRNLVILQIGFGPPEEAVARESRRHAAAARAARRARRAAPAAGPRPAGLRTPPAVRSYGYRPSDATSDMDTPSSRTHITTSRTASSESTPTISRSTRVTSIRIDASDCSIWSGVISRSHSRSICRL